MPTRLRPARLALLASLAAALACSKEVSAPIACDTTASCPPASRCVRRTCTADAPPVAEIASLEGVQANDLAVLDGSRSSDPDAPGDAVVSYQWTARAVDAPCDPPVIAGTTARPQVRFACPGRYEVSLVVTDELSVGSAPASVFVDVAPRSGEPLVTATADVAVDHRCSGEPLACRPVTELDGAVRLSAISAVEGVRFRWSVEPPEGRALGATRRVTFVPGPDVAAPLVWIETDGTAISGDWVLRVEARDSAGVVGTGATRVSVGNAPPLVTETFVENSHVFDAPSSRFTARGTISVVLSDPDGDPLEGRTVSEHHVGDGGAPFVVADLGDRVTFAVQVPYTQPSDAGFLIGGEGLERTIELAIRDVNGTETREVWPVIIGNSPPELLAPVQSLSVNHTYSAGAYRASAVLTSWRDPDGDPLAPGSPTGDAACSSYALDGSGRVVVQCSLASPVAAMAGTFVGLHDVQQFVQDPWSRSPTTVTRLDILNQPPVLTKPRATHTASCTVAGGCCDSQCWFPKFTMAATTVEIGSFVTDPDGDPVRVTITPTGQTMACLPWECSFSAPLAAEVTCTATANDSFGISVTDGAATVTGTTVVSRVCG